MLLIKSPHNVSIFIYRTCLLQRHDTPLEFRFIEITCLINLKSIKDNLLWYLDNQIVVEPCYHLPSINNEGKIQFIKFELKTDEHLVFMWFTFPYYKTKSSINLDATIAKSTKYILKMLKYFDNNLLIIKCNIRFTLAKKKYRMFFYYNVLLLCIS